MRPANVLANVRPDLVRANAQDDRRTLPQLAPASISEGIMYGTFQEQVDADQLALAQTAPTERLMRGLPAATFARNRIANAVASMSPLCAYTAAGDEITPTPDIVARPLKTMGIFDFWFDALGHAITRGNFVGIPMDHDAYGWPRQVLPINCDYVSCYIDGAGFTVYDILGRRLSSEQVVHIRGPHTNPGQPWAMSPVQNFRHAIGEAIDVQTYGADSFRNSAVPSVAVVLDAPGPIPQEVLDGIKAGWLATYGQAKRQPAVLPKSMSVTPLMFSPHDAEFIEAKKLSIAECALMFDLSPADLSVSIGGDSQTYANITDRQNVRIVETYGPWMRRFEEAWSDLLPRDQYCHFEPERTARMSPRERAELQEIRLRSGVTTVDEERALDGREPLAARRKELPS